ncbi:universal stress protein [Nocardioides sp. NPDC092400]|uniref:universal stress protein n=1 Tax=Nocardioides sp. NPDC092400 TaxID=3155196 RepID=UPI0034253EF8
MTATTDSQVPAGSVVVGVDGSTHAADAVAWAAEQAALEGRRLVLLHAADAVSATASLWMASMAVDPGQVRHDIEVAGREVLAEAAAGVREARPGLEVVELLQLVDPRQALLDASTAAAVVVVGSHGRGPVSSLLLGSVGVAVARHATSPVVVVRPTARGVARRGVVVGVDGTAGSLPALEAAYRQASERRLPLTVVHCFWDVVAATGPAEVLAPTAADVEEIRLLVGESISGMAEEFPDVPVTVELARGLAEEVLGRGSAAHDLVVVGRQQHGPVSALLRGSVSTAVLERAACPVLVVPGAD